MAEEENQPSSVIDRLKQQILQLEEEEDECENDFEELLANNPELVHRTLSDIINTKQVDYRCMPNTALEGVLKYFKGTSLGAKKAKFLRFITVFHCFKTQDLNLLKRRLKRLRKAARVFAEAGQLNTPFWQEILNMGFLID